jgi:hypothetical protein
MAQRCSHTAALRLARAAHLFQTVLQRGGVRVVLDLGLPQLQQQQRRRCLALGSHLTRLPREQLAKGGRLARRGGVGRACLMLQPLHGELQPGRGARRLRESSARHPRYTSPRQSMENAISTFLHAEQPHVRLDSVGAHAELRLAQDV